MVESTSKPILEGEKDGNLGEVQLGEALESPNKLETDETTMNQQARDNSDVCCVFVTVGSCTMRKPYFSKDC